MKRGGSLGILLVTLLLGVLFGWRLFGAGNPAPTVTREALLMSLKSEGFLVSQTAILDQTVTIDRSTGSAFKDFFWGQNISARARMKVSSGIDLTKLSEENIQIESGSITVTLPEVETHSVELASEIELENNQGILKKIFDNDDGYNVALQELTAAARSAANSDDLRQEARASAQKEIERLIRFVEEEREVTVN